MKHSQCLCKYLCRNLQTADRKVVSNTGIKITRLNENKSLKKISTIKKAIKSSVTSPTNEFKVDDYLFIYLSISSSDIYVMPISTKQFIYEIKSPLMLRGDIFIHFFQLHNRSRRTELISSVQFHTCAITRNEVEFHKSDISFPRSGNFLTILNRLDAHECNFRWEISTGS